MLSADAREEARPAMFWHSPDGREVVCGLCRHRCRIGPGRRGRCGWRVNRDGRLSALTYGRAAALAVDPVEKKPLYHFIPGSRTFSLAARGCNFSCLHCQNATLSDPSGAPPSGDPWLPPEQVVGQALAHGCRAIAYTYTEPTVFFEYALDTAQLAAGRGLKNIFVSNGYISEPALRHIAPHLDAANIDLKFFDDALYREVCGARLNQVLESIELYHHLGIWMELTTLVIPGYNDDQRQLGQIAAFIAALDPEIPWHVTAFRPCHKMTETPPARLAGLMRARDIGRESGLAHVYTGNLPSAEGGITRCPGCSEVLLDRSGHGLARSVLGADGACPRCARRLPGVW